MAEDINSVNKLTLRWLRRLLPTQTITPEVPRPQIGKCFSRVDRLLLVVVGLLPEPQTHCHSAQVCRSESHSNMRTRGDTVAVATNQR